MQTLSAWNLRCLILIGACLGWLFRGSLRGETVFAADVGLFTYPNLELLGQVYRSGSVPGWNPFMGLGGPLLGDAGLAPFYPGNVLLLVLPTLVALELLLYSHLLIGALGLFALARRLGQAPTVACLVAAAFTLGGVGLGNLNTPYYVLAYAWVPFAVLGLDRLVHLDLEASGADRWRARLLAAVPFALIFLAGRPEVCVVAALLGLLLVNVRRRRLAVSGAQLVLTGFLAAGLVAFALVPTLDAVAQSERASGLSLDLAGRWSLHPSELLGLLVPAPLGAEGIPLESVGLERRPWYASLYLGIVPLACALFGASTDRRARWLVGGAVAIFVVALGVHTPVYRTLYPLLSWVRYPAKLAAPACLLLALAAGCGLAQLQAERRRGLMGTLIVLSVLAAGVAALSFFQGSSRLGKDALQVVVVSALGAAIVQRFERPQRALLLLTLVDLTLAASVGSIPRDVIEHPPTLAQAVRQAEARAGAPLRVVTLDEAAEIGVSPVGAGVLESGAEVSSGTIEQFSWRESLCPNTGMPHGVRTLRAFTPLLGERTARLRAEAERLGVDRDALLRRQGVSLVLDAGSEPADRPLLARAGPYRVTWLRGARPWAELTDAVRWASGDDALEQVLATPDASETVLEPSPSFPTSGVDLSPGEGAIGTVALQTQGYDELVFQVDAARPAVLVVREAWSPRWTATVNGEPAPVLPADTVFRAVPVPAGTSVVALKHGAEPFWIGLVLTALTGLFLIGVQVFGAQPRG